MSRPATSFSIIANRPLSPLARGHCDKIGIKIARGDRQPERILIYRDVSDPELNLIQAIEHLSALEFLTAVTISAAKVRHILRSEKVFAELERAASMLAHMASRAAGSNETVHDPKRADDVA
jgi:hypothetical protein